VYTIASALQTGELRLKLSGLDPSPRLNAELMLQAATGLDRTSLLFRHNEALSLSDYERYDDFLTRRQDGEPVQYIVGSAPFYGYQFLVGKDSFIPRFDSESMVEKAIQWLLDRNLASQLPKESPLVRLDVLDLCCGCGAIGLSIAREVSNIDVTLVDSEATPLKYAALNAQALQISDRVFLARADALGPFPLSWSKRFDLIVANPPYIPLSDIASLPGDVRDREPHNALTDGGDGLSFYRSWTETVPGIMKRDGVFLTEIGDGACNAVVDILSDHFCITKIVKDISGIDRAIEAVVR